MSDPMSEYKSSGGYEVILSGNGTFEVRKHGTPVHTGFRTSDEAWEWVDEQSNEDSPE